MKNGTLPLPSFARKIYEYFFPLGYTQKIMKQLKPSEAPFNVTSSSNKVTQAGIAALPPELFGLIFPNLDLKDLLSCKLVDSRFYNLVSSHKKTFNGKGLPYLLKYNLNIILPHALSTWTKYSPKLLFSFRPSFSASRMQNVRRDLRKFAWVLRYIDPRLGKQFCRKWGLHPYGFSRKFENLNEITFPEFQSEKFEKQEDLFRFLSTLLISKKKDYLKTVVKFFRLIILAYTDLIDKNFVTIFEQELETISEDDWTGPTQQPQTTPQYLYGSLFHLLRIVHGKDSNHPSKDLRTMNFILDLINGDLFQSNPKRLLHSLDQCLSHDQQALSTIPYLNQTINYYKPHLKAFLLLLTKHADEAMKILRTIPTDPERMGILTPLLSIALGTLENDEKKADPLFECICTFAPDRRIYTFLSQKRLIAYFQEKFLNQGISNLKKNQVLDPILIINRLRDQQILIGAANKWLELENPDSDEKRTEIFKKHSSIICQLLFNLPNSFWRDIEKTKRIKKMAESVPNTPGIGYATIAAIRLRALWAISNQTEREELLADLRLQIEPTLSPLEEEG